jgi:hypothetical protein
MGNIWVFDAKKIVRSPTLAAGDHTKSTAGRCCPIFGEQHWETSGCIDQQNKHFWKSFDISHLASTTESKGNLIISCS